MEAKGPASGSAAVEPVELQQVTEPSRRKAHGWPYALTCTKDPDGGNGTRSGKSAQQLKLPCVSTAQVYSNDALTSSKVPVGGRSKSPMSSPQQASVPSVRIPQLC